MMQKIQAVLFDLDGTLLNTIDGIALAMNNVLKKHRYPTHSVGEYKKLVGRGVPNLVKNACSATINAEAYAECLRDMDTEYAKSWQQTTRPYDGVLEMLEALKERHLLMAILSNKPNELTIANVKALLPFESFFEVRGALPDVPVKPAPDGALAIAEKCGISPSSWLYLGDTDVDMQTARHAGMFPVGAEWGFRDRAELEANGAEVVLNNPLELIQVLTDAKKIKI